MIEGTDLNAHRAAVIFVEIWETKLVPDIGLPSVIMLDRVLEESNRGAFFMADPAVFAEFPHPAVRVGFACW